MGMSAFSKAIVDLIIAVESHVNKSEQVDVDQSITDDYAVIEAARRVDEEFRAAIDDTARNRDQ